MENPCFEHGHEEEDRSPDSHRFRLLALAGLVSVVLPLIVCCVMACIKILSRNYCTENPHFKDERHLSPLASAIYNQEMGETSTPSLGNEGNYSPILTLAKGTNKGTNGSSSPIYGYKRLQLTNSASVVVCEDLAHRNQVELIQPPLSPSQAKKQICRPSQYYCGDHKHRVVYRYYKPNDQFFSPENSPRL